MNYKKLYFNIIRNRRNNPLPVDEYGEVHHIKPRSFGGLDTPNNLIHLSAREHFIVHFLLYKMYKHRVENVFPRSEREKERYKKMTWAFNIMINAKSKLQKRLNKNINNRVFEQLRKAVSAVQIKYPYEFVKTMFDFYIDNKLTPSKMDVLNKKFNTSLSDKALKKLFEFHKLKVTEHPEYRHIGQKYSAETIKEMFNFYISNDLSPKTIHVLNKKFNQNLTYTALKKLFYKNNLKISEYQR